MGYLSSPSVSQNTPNNSIRQDQWYTWPLPGALPTVTCSVLRSVSPLDGDTCKFVPEGVQRLETCSDIISKRGMEMMIQPRKEQFVRSLLEGHWEDLGPLFKEQAPVIGNSLLTASVPTKPGSADTIGNLLLKN